MKYGNYIIDENNNTSIAKIVKTIKKKSNVIEFGSSYGYILKYLKDHKECNVYGYEIDKEGVKLANEHGIPTEYIDLDATKKDFFENLDTTIDYIICADVLEHLKNMSNVIKLISLYLERNKNCTLLVSFPNITYYGVVDQLLHGNFKYQDLGILDNTHLRFYDKYELEKIFNNNNLEIKSIDNINITPENSEFKVKLDKQVIDILESYKNENYLTYQYVIQLQYSLAPIKKLNQTTSNKSVIKEWNNNLTAQIIELNNMINLKDSQIIELNNMINLKDSQIIELNNTVNLKDSQIIELNTLAHKQQDNIQSLTKEVEPIKNIINNLQQKLKESSIKQKIKSLLGL